MNAALELTLNNKNPNHKRIKKIIQKNCLFMILEAIGNNRNYFSSDYIREIEKNCPFSLSYLSRLRSDMKKRMSKLHTIDISLKKISDFLLFAAKQIGRPGTVIGK